MQNNFTIKSITMTTKCEQCKRDADYQKRLGYDPDNKPNYCACGSTLVEVLEFKRHCAVCGNREYVKVLKCKVRASEDQPFPWGFFNTIKNAFTGKAFGHREYEGRNLILKPKHNANT